MEEFVTKQLKEIFSNFKKRPVAFIGSGISKRYMNTPTWIDLLKNTFAEYNNNPAEFGQMIREYGLDHLDQIASIVEKGYDNYFIKQICTNSSHKDYQLYLNNKESIDNGKIHPYKVYTANVFKQAILNSTFNNEKNEFITFIGKCANIITTNYDNLLESISSLDVIIGNKDFISDKCIGYGELYKIHGCCNNPTSMVLTSKDYQEFNEKKSFYHAKLLLSFIQQPIIFLGYSLSDNYIEEMLNDVAKMLDEDDLEILSKRLVFIEYTDDNQTTIREKIVKNLQMTCIRTNDFKAIYRIMSDNIKEGIPLELVKKFQEAVKNFIYEQDNPDALPVKGIEDIKNPKELTAFHIGYKDKRQDMIVPNDLIIDLIKNNIDYLTNQEIINIIERENNQRFSKQSFFPIYKYLAPDKKHLARNLNSKIYTSMDQIYKSLPKVGDRVLSSKEETIKKVKDEVKDYCKISYIFSNLEKLDVGDIRMLVEYIWDHTVSKNSLLSDSNFRKLVCVLDFMEYS